MLSKLFKKIKSIIWFIIKWFFLIPLALFIVVGLSLGLYENLTGNKIAWPGNSEVAEIAEANPVEETEVLDAAPAVIETEPAIENSEAYLAGLYDQVFHKCDHEAANIPANSAFLASYFHWSVAYDESYFTGMREGHELIHEQGEEFACAYLIGVLSNHATITKRPTPTADDREFAFGTGVYSAFVADCGYVLDGSELGKTHHQAVATERMKSLTEYHDGLHLVYDLVEKFGLKRACDEIAQGVIKPSDFGIKPDIPENRSPLLN